MANSTTSIVTPAGWLSFPHLTVDNKSEKGKFEAGIVFKPGTDLSKLEALVEEARNALPDSEPKAAYKSPLSRDGSEKSHLGGHYVEGAKFFTAKSNFPPQLLEKSNEAGQPPTPILDPASDVYAGAVVRLLVHAYTFNTDGNRGIAFGLDGVEKIADAERIGGGPDAAAAFGDSEPVDYSDMLS